MGNLIVLGGGICGLAAAQMFADDGHDVTVLERDADGPPSDAHEAFEWKRRGVAQFGLGHWMQARGSSIVRQDLPRTYELLLQNGGLEFNLVNFLLSMQPDASPEAEDARFDQLTARRSTLEWAFATAATEHHGIMIRRGEAVAGLLSNNSGPVPRVTGVRLESGEELTADLVIDVTGRRSQTPEMLAAIGATAPLDDGADSGFAYYGRYFRSSDGTTSGMIAPLLTPYGSFSLLTLQPTMAHGRSRCMASPTTNRCADFGTLTSSRRCSMPARCTPTGSTVNRSLRSKQWSEASTDTVNS